MHEDEGLHSHQHSHSGEHVHVHQTGKKNVTPWALFTIFVLGSCEPLIPLLMYPAAKSSITRVLAVTAIFGITIIITMLGIVMFSSWGVSFVKLNRFEKYAHAAVKKRYVCPD